MKKIITLFILLSVIGCNKNEKLDKNFKKILIEYQNKYPTPTNKNLIKNKIFIYSAYFWSKKSDTILVLSRSSSGLTPNIKGYGIYQDELLKPTFITDEANYSNKFILSKIKNIDKKYYWLNKTFYESSPPIYTYSIKNKEIKLIKIDTVWKSWD